jgi:hypothetical protein
LLSLSKEKGIITMEPFIPREEEMKNPIGVAECLVNLNKHVIKWGIAHVDDSTVISKELAREVVLKCIRVQALLLKDGSVMTRTGNGRGGFIRGKSLKSSPGGKTTVSFAVYPITAKHNLRCVIDTTTPACHYRPLLANLLLSSSHLVAVSWSSDVLGWEPTEADSFNLREGGEARPVFWNYGFDVGLGSVIEEEGNHACTARRSFERVSKDFKFGKRTEGWNGCSFRRGYKPTCAEIGVEEDAIELASIGESEIQDFYGGQRQVSIYTGEITDVGPKHIEYINSFTGCAGAIVFLSDMEQPVSVEKSNWGKAVAVHAGGHPSLSDQNFGFLNKEHPVFKEFWPKLQIIKTQDHHM